MSVRRKLKYNEISNVALFHLYFLTFPNKTAYKVMYSETEILIDNKTGNNLYDRQRSIISCYCKEQDVETYIYFVFLIIK